MMASPWHEAVYIFALQAAVFCSNDVSRLSDDRQPLLNDLRIKRPFGFGALPP
jgi:hypothetical protein